MKFTEVYKEIDNAQHHMKTVISNILRKMITAKAKKDCYGCVTDHPSQREHMDSGCLSSWEAKRETYMFRQHFYEHCVKRIQRSFQ